MNNKEFGIMPIYDEELYSRSRVSKEISLTMPTEMIYFYQAAIGEGWDFDGLTQEEFISLMPDQQQRAIEAYQKSIGNAVLGIIENITNPSV